MSAMMIRDETGLRRALAIPLAVPLAATILLLGAAGPAAAQDAVAQFYRGKTVNLYVGADIGGGYDSYARLIQRHLGRRIPGNPTVVAQNMPGAGGNKAATYMYFQAPKDGTAIAAIQPGVMLAPLISSQPVQHDPSKFNYLGSANADSFLCFVRHDAPATTFKDVFTTEVIMGAPSEAASPRDFPTMLNNLLGTKLRIITGYAGTRQVMIAIERGEVHGMCGQAWSSLTVQHPDWVSSGFVKVLAQEGTRGHPEMDRLGAPLTVSFAKSEEDRQVMELVYSQGQFGRPYILAPGMAPERVAALRKAFLDTLRDKDFLADAEKGHYDIEPLSGEDFQALVSKMYALPPKVLQRARQSLIRPAN